MPSQEDFEKEAKAIGERLALLLAAADMPDEAKAGIAAMIPEMSPEQMDQLMTILQDNVRDGTTELTQELDKTVAEAQEQYEQARAAAQQQALDDMDEIQRALDSSSKGP